MRARFVLDVSVTLGWIFEDEADRYTDLVLESFERYGTEALVPMNWSIELAEALLAAERNHAQDGAPLHLLSDLIRRLPIRPDPETADRALTTIAALARSSRVSLGEAAYLELACRMGLPMATHGERLMQACGILGVPVFYPGM